MSDSPKPDPLAPHIASPIPSSARGSLVFRSLKIRSKLLLIVAVTAMLFAATVLSLGMVAQRHVLTTMDTELERSRQVVAEFIASRWRQLDAGLHSLVDSPEIRAILITDGIDQETRLTSITDLQHMLGVDAVLYCDGDGKTLARTDNPFDNESIVSDNLLIQKALTGETSQGFWGVRGRTLLAMAFPVKQDGTVKGIVLAGLDIENQGTALRSLLLRDVIVARQGHVLVTSIPKEAELDTAKLLRGQASQPHLVSELLHLPLVEATWNDGQQLMAATVFSQASPEETIQSVVLVPVDSVFGFYRDFRLVLILMGSLTIGLSILVTFRVAAGISDKVRNTLETLRRVASGDLSARLNIVSGDEFGCIATSLNIAIEASAKSLNELAECNQEMNHLLSKVEQAQAEKEELYEELISVARQAGMAEVATDVLHNVGNVLNSVNVSAQVVSGKLNSNRADGLVRACGLIDQHRTSLGEFLTNDSRGQKLPEFLNRLADTLVRENKEVLTELTHLIDNIEHIKQIVAMQQSLAKTCSLHEPVDLVKLVENAERMNDSSLIRHAVTVHHDYQVSPTIVTDKHKVLQILVNLIKNAKQAVGTVPQSERWIRLSIDQPNDSSIAIRVSDNGVGIPPENIEKMFTHGFTTKATGHGFGLHSGALTARELGGTLSVQSDGLGRGATFTLELPLKVPSTTTPYSAPSTPAIIVPMSSSNLVPSISPTSNGMGAN